MQTTKFRVWLQNRRKRPDWTGIELLDWHQHLEAGCIDVTVKGNGDDLRRLIAKRRDIFAAYIQLMPEQREDNGALAVPKPPPRPHR